MFGAICHATIQSQLVIGLPLGCYRSIIEALNPLTTRFSDELYSRSDKLSYLANYTLYQLETIH